MTNLINIEYQLSQEIIKKQSDIILELKTILLEKDGYKYNYKTQKIKKHFPASVNIIYDTHSNFIIKEINKNRKVSYSLSSKNIKEQLNEFLNTAIRRYNFTKVFKNDIDLLKCLLNKYVDNLPMITPIDIRYNLIKYDNQNDIIRRFPHFANKDKRVFYDVVYLIRTENYHYYIDGNNNRCEYILICCNNKQFNIMFEADNEQNNNIIRKCPEEIIKYMYNEKNI